MCVLQFLNFAPITNSRRIFFGGAQISLPTGLGKTFIAAVVMYNFYRWYPFGKIIFMAPTRPLVKQQEDACFNITAIPKDVTVELTGKSTILDVTTLFAI